MAEQKLEVTTNESNGKTYYNLNLKENVKKGTKGIDDGNFIIVKKRFAEGMERNSQYGKSYSCAVEYDGKQASFWLNEREHDVYKNVGGQDDLVRITLNEEKYINKKTGAKGLRAVLSFELVDPE